MQTNRDYIPSNNAEFNSRVNNLLAVVKENTLDSNPPKRDHIPQDAVYKLENHVEAWNDGANGSCPTGG